MSQNSTLSYSDVKSWEWETTVCCNSGSLSGSGEGTGTGTGLGGVWAQTLLWTLFNSTNPKPLRFQWRHLKCRVREGLNLESFSSMARSDVQLLETKQIEKAQHVRVHQAHVELVSRTGLEQRSGTRLQSSSEQRTRPQQRCSDPIGELLINTAVKSGNPVWTAGWLPAKKSCSHPNEWAQLNFH